MGCGESKQAVATENTITRKSFVANDSKGINEAEAITTTEKRQETTENKDKSAEDDNPKGEKHEIDEKEITEEEPAEEKPSKVVEVEASSRKDDEAVESVVSEANTVYSSPAHESSNLDRALEDKVLAEETKEEAENGKAEDVNEEAKEAEVTAPVEVKSEEITAEENGTDVAAGDQKTN